MNPALTRPEKPVAPAAKPAEYFFIAEYKAQLYVIEGEPESLQRIQKDLYLKGGFVAKTITPIVFLGTEPWTRLTAAQFYSRLYS